MTAICPVCRVPHETVVWGPLVVIACPMCPPGKLFGFDLRLDGTQVTAGLLPADPAPAGGHQHVEAQ